MINSALMVFSIINNINDYIKKDNNIDIFKKNYIKRFENAPSYFLENSKRIYNEIENGYYTLIDLGVFLLYYNMINKKFTLYDVKFKNVKKVNELFSLQRLKNDLELLKNIQIELKFKNLINDIFKINEDGTSIIYHLTITEKISPVIFIRNFQYVLTNEKEDVIINNEYKRFEKIANIIKILKERRFLNEQR